MFAVVVTFCVKAECVDAFLPLILENAATSLRDEPGCHQFDVATDPARPGEVLLYELYTDAGAFAVHLKSAHFLAFATESDRMITEKSVKTYESVRQ